jgi:class 3 adenylate cyclase
VRRLAFPAVALLVPIAGLFLLLGMPDLDRKWEHQPAHFWLVLVSALLAFLVGLLMAEAAGRRGDARVLLVSLAFLSTSGFLGLHALATPGVLLSGKNAGFQIASAIGLVIGACFAAASALPFGTERAMTIVRHRRLLIGSVLGAMVLWAVIALGTLPPLEDPITPEAARDPLLAVWVLGVVLYGYAAYRYGRLCTVRKAPVAVAVVAAWVLLAEAMLAVAVSRNWQLTWWEWHLLMLLAFGLVAYRVWGEWKREGSSAEIFADLYEERTLGHREQVSVLFADLQGYTTFAESMPPDDVRAMMNEYFATVVPVIESESGELVQTVGDQIFAVFKQPGHEKRAAKAGLRLQETTATLAELHPDWPRFRVGINSGEAHVGLVKAPGARYFSPTGDVVNTGSRLEGQARAGEVVISETTRAALGNEAVLEDLGELPVKGKERRVQAFVLRALSPGGAESHQRLQDQDAERRR